MSEFAAVGRLMRVIEFKIPTSHNEWTVSLRWGGFFHPYDGVMKAFFYCSGREMNRNEIQKTIWKRAKCFLSDPNRFGEVRYI